MGFIMNPPFGIIFFEFFPNIKQANPNLIFTTEFEFNGSVVIADHGQPVP